MPSDADRVKTLRHALQQIAAGPCTGRVPGCRYPRNGVCPKHQAESALTKDDWDAPLDQPGYNAEVRGLGAS